MTREDVIRMARAVCDSDKVDPYRHGYWIIKQEELEKFATLVAAHEREVWAKGAKISVPTMTMEQEFTWHRNKGYEQGKALIPAAVAAEREACAKVCEAHWRFNGSASECADAIRARGEK
jgi:hypothetical protein